MTLTFDLLTPKSIGHILDSWGASVWSFMIIGGLHSQLWSGNHFQTSIIHDLDLWPFDPKINRAHPWLMGSKCMKFHYYIKRYLTYSPETNCWRPPARPPHIRLRAEFCNSANNISYKYKHLINIYPGFYKWLHLFCYYPGFYKWLHLSCYNHFSSSAKHFKGQ